MIWNAQKIVTFQVTYLKKGFKGKNKIMLCGSVPVDSTFFLFKKIFFSRQNFTTQEKKYLKRQIKGVLFETKNIFKGVDVKIFNGHLGQSSLNKF